MMESSLHFSSGPWRAMSFQSRVDNYHLSCVPRICYLSARCSQNLLTSIHKLRMMRNDYDKRMTINYPLLCTQSTIKHPNLFFIFVTVFWKELLYTSLTFNQPPTTAVSLSLRAGDPKLTWIADASCGASFAICGCASSSTSNETWSEPGDIECLFSKEGMVTSQILTQLYANYIWPKVYSYRTPFD